jgi:hypothetical protein
MKKRVRVSEADLGRFDVKGGIELSDCPFLIPKWHHGIEGVSPVTPFVGGRR